jgi:hypothetical protein
MRSALFLSVIVTLAAACVPKQDYKVETAGLDEPVAEVVVPLTTARVVEGLRNNNASFMPSSSGSVFTEGRDETSLGVLAAARVRYGRLGDTGAVIILDTAKVGGAAALCRNEIAVQKQAAKERANPEPRPDSDKEDEGWGPALRSYNKMMSAHELKSYDALPGDGCRIEEISLFDSIPRYIYIQPLPGNPQATVLLMFDVPVAEWGRSGVDYAAEGFFRAITVVE